MDFGVDQDPQVIQGLDQAYAELINVLNLLNQQQKDIVGSQYMEEEKDPIDTIVAEETPGKQDILAGKLYGLKNRIPEEVFYAIRKLINSGDIEKAEELLNRLTAPKQPTSVKADPSTFSVNEKKGKDLDGDGDVDSDDYLKARDIAIQKAKAKKSKMREFVYLQMVQLLILSHLTKLLIH